MRANSFWKAATIVGGVALGVGISSPAAAQTATANLSVTLSVANNCTIATAPVAFGAYDPVVANLTNPLDATGTVTVACTRGSLPEIGLGLGSHAAGSVRRLSNGGSDFVSYELYNESTRNTVWSTSGAGLLSAGAAPSIAPRNFTVYGRVAGGQDVPSGSYADSVVATVNF